MFCENVYVIIIHDDSRDIGKEVRVLFENIPELKEYIDLTTGLGRVRDNKSLYAKMLGLFLKNTEFQQLDEQLAAGDLVEAERVAHAIKGMTGNLSLESVFHLSTEMMNQLKSGVYDEATHDALKDAYQKTREYVQIVIDEFSK